MVPISDDTSHAWVGIFIFVPAVVLLQNKKAMAIAGTGCFLRLAFLLHERSLTAAPESLTELAALHGGFWLLAAVVGATSTVGAKQVQAVRLPRQRPRLCLLRARRALRGWRR